MNLCKRFLATVLGGTAACWGATASAQLNVPIGPGSGGSGGLISSVGSGLTVNGSGVISLGDANFTYSSGALATTSLALGGATIGSNKLAVTGTSQFNGTITLANADGITGTTTAAQGVTMVLLDSGNNLNFGNSLVTGQTVFLPGSGKQLRFESSNASAYAIAINDGTQPTISFGTNVSDGWITFYNPLATTGDTVLKWRDGAANGAHLDFETSAGSANVGIAHTASGVLTITQGTTTFTNLGSLALLSLTASGTVKTGVYTVATLPVGTQGMRALVTDATSCTLNGSLAGSSSTVCPVYYNGTSWLGG
jgi:hypothetical protein